MSWHLFRSQLRVSMICSRFYFAADPVAAAAVPPAATGTTAEKQETRPRSSASHHRGDMSTNGEDLAIVGLGRRLSASLGSTD